MNLLYKWALAFGVSVAVLANTSYASDQCMLDVYDFSFNDEVRKLAVKNRRGKQNFDLFKDDFGFRKIDVDLVDSIKTGKYVEELKFISSWKDTDKAISPNAKSVNFSQWQPKISPTGQPNIISELGMTMKTAGDDLLDLSLAINAFEVFTEDEKTSKAAAANIYKFTMGDATTQNSSKSLGLALVGVSFMDYAANHTAYDKYENDQWETYSKFLRTAYKRSSWAKLYSTDGQAGVDARLHEYWDNKKSETGTYNFAEKRLTSATDISAFDDYPKPFADRYITETLVPGLGHYFANEADSAGVDIEITLKDTCDRLMRQMGEVDKLKNAIDAARTEIDLRANQEEVDDDDWGDVDEIDDVIFSAVSEQEKWRIRDGMAAQQDFDQARSDAIAGQSYAAIEQRRAEEARIKEEKRRQFVAAMQEISAGLTQAAAQIREADQETAAAVQQNNQAYDNIFKRADEQNNFMNRCIANTKPTPGFPTLDPHANRMACADKYRKSGTSSTAQQNKQPYSNVYQRKNFVDRCIANIKPTPGFPTLDPYANRLTCEDKYRQTQSGR